MKRGILFLLFLMVVDCPLYAQSKLGKAPADSLGIMLENYNYPYTVSFMQAKLQNIPVIMAYMDVMPANYAGKNILLLHGKNFPAAYWGDAIKTFCEKGYRVIAPDQVGFGKSSKPEVEYSFQELAELTRQLLDTLHIDHMYIIGHSTGGMLAAKFTLLYPNMVAKLILEDPIGLEDYKAEGATTKTKDWYKQEKNQKYADILALHKKYYANWQPSYKEWADVQYRMTKSENATQLAHVNALTYRMIVTQPVLYEFKKIKTPTLILFGQNDKTKIAKGVPAAGVALMGDYQHMAPAAAKMFPNGRSFEVENCGHVPHLEQKTIFYSQVLSFLR